MVKLYKMDLSPPARAAMMGCEIYGVPVELVDVDLMKKENRSPDYLKKNPMHTIPLLEDGSLYIHDSHAILMYLADKYGKNDELYPKDVAKRALVNQKLLFDTSNLFPKLRNITLPAFFEGVRKPTKKQLDEIVEAYQFTEEFLNRTKYIALDSLTIADIAAFTSVTALICIVPLAGKYPKIQGWLDEIYKLPYVQKWHTPGNVSFEKALKTVLDL